MEDGRRIDTRIDLLKCLAIAGVMLIHTAANCFVYPIGSAAWLSGLFWGSIARGSVPVFLMCSGALLLDPGYDFSFRRFYTKNALRIVAALFFWSCVYKIYRLALTGSLTGGNLLTAGIDVMLFRHEGHLYYLHMVILVYLLLPVGRALVQNADKQLLSYAVCLWYVLGIVYPTLRPFRPFDQLSGIPAQWMMNMAYAANGYALLGYYLKKYGQINRSFYSLAAATGLIGVFAGTYALSLRTGALYTKFFDGTSVPVSLLAGGVYGIVISAARISSAKCAAFLRFGAKASFCIYLLHVMVLDLLSACFKYSGLGFFLRIPLMVLLNGLICGMAYCILRLIPVCGKYLI
ncbi:MAG: acyltransferase [Firmicutes bacterium]|nr:acyltransferase [Bacillota bacterium]